MESGQTKIASFVIGLRLAKELGTTAWYLAVGGADERDIESSDTLTQRVTALEQRVSLLLDSREKP